MFKGIVITKDDSGYTAKIDDIAEDQLPEGNVTVAVEWSTVNYKDSLAITGSAPVIRSFPMVPGIDFAGVVEASSDARYAVGSAVLLNGWGVGEKHWGGLAQKVRVNGDWLIALPKGLSTRQAMSMGTAGYTAMLCVMALEEGGISPASGQVLVTGATGGVGSVAVALLAKRGFSVIAATGKPDEASYLTELGAASIIDRAELEVPGKSLAKERWAAAIDTIGSVTLANVCAGTSYGGVVAACGMAGGLDFHASVAPFILRGVTLAGVDSVMCPRPKRELAWQLLAREYDHKAFDMMARAVPLSETLDVAKQQIAGRIRGRIVVDVNA